MFSRQSLAKSKGALRRNPGQERKGHPWQAIFASLQLEKGDRRKVDAFLAEKGAQTLLPAVEVLRQFRLEAEAEELLHWGVQRYPSLAVARVALAEALFQKGLARDCWNLLGAAVKPLTSNLTAQRLLFQCAILLGETAAAGPAIDTLRHRGHVPEALAEVDTLLRLEGVASAQTHLRQVLAGQGIQPLIEPLPAAKGRPDGNSVLGPHWADDLGPLPESLSGYAVAAAHQILRGVPAGKLITDVAVATPTLARVYEAQGYLEQSRKIYQQLHLGSPQNDFFARKIRELTDQIRKAAAADQGDPRQERRWQEQIATDFKIRYLNDLLGRLPAQGADPCTSLSPAGSTSTS